MSKTTIEWCQMPGTKPETWNPTTGCNKVSQGCKNCYAEIMHKRLAGMGQSKYQQAFLNGAVFHKATLDIPATWKEPRTVFINSMSDLFHENLSLESIVSVLNTIASHPQHTFIALTKRADIMERVMNRYYYSFHPFFAESFNLQQGILQNLFLGVSVEDQPAAARIPHLLQTPAAVRFLSCEPLIGPLDLSPFLKPSNYTYKGESGGYTLPALDWVIVGGESGRNARPMHPDWARCIKYDCQAANVPFFFKQWGEYLPFEADAQPPFYNRCDTGEMFDGHNMNFIDRNTGEAGKFLGHRWYDTFDGLLINQETKSSDCVYLKMGKHNAGRRLDGIEYNQFPNIKKQTNA